VTLHSRTLVPLLAATLLLSVSCVGVAPAQQKDTSGSAVQDRPPAANTKSADATDKPTTATMTPAEARQAQLVADTQRLYQLTQELKEEVAKSNKDTLSVSVIKKADEVERLAKSLKERMKAAQ
jgi:hypothetical protein